MTIRGVSEEVYQVLKKCANRNRRSMQEQIKAILDREAHLIEGGHLAKARQWRMQLAGRKLGNVVADIRKDRRR